VKSDLLGLAASTKRKVIDIVVHYTCVGESVYWEVRATIVPPQRQQEAL
jgi:hypothetical protein